MDNKGLKRTLSEEKNEGAKSVINNIMINDIRIES